MYIMLNILLSQVSHLDWGSAFKEYPEVKIQISVYQ